MMNIAITAIRYIAAMQILIEWHINLHNLDALLVYSINEAIHPMIPAMKKIGIR